MKTVKVLFYCTKNGGDLLYFGYGSGEFRCVTNQNIDYVFDTKGFDPNDISHQLNGFIVSECDIDMEYIWPEWNYIDATEMDGNATILEKGCLSRQQLANYGKGKTIHALFIHNLNHYKNNPKRLKDFNNSKGMPLKKAPQNMCYVYDQEGNEYILISVHPKPLEDILNGKKTIEFRKSILNSIKKAKKVYY